MTQYFYTKEHEWLAIEEDNLVRVGITEYAIKELGDIVFVELPAVDDEVAAEDEVATVESVKSTSGIYSPAAGVIKESNERLEDEPELMNESPMEDGWIYVMEVTESVDVSQFMDHEAYEAYIADLS